MIVTLFTDAGYRADLRLASYAAWAKADGLTYRRAGLLSGEVSNVTVAELKALANGFALIRATFNPPRKSLIIAQTDSLNAIQILQGKARRNAEVAMAVGFIFSIVRDQDWRLDLRHVKAHKGTVTPRNAVNTWCDQQCTLHLRQAVKARAAVAPEAPTDGPILAESPAP